MKRKLTIALICLAVLATGLLYSSPYIRVYQILAAIQGQDHEQLVRYIDFPRLRQGLKETGAVGRSAPRTPGRTRPGSPRNDGTGSGSNHRTIGHPERLGCDVSSVHGRPERRGIIATECGKRRIVRLFRIDRPFCGLSPAGPMHLCLFQRIPYYPPGRKQEDIDDRFNSNRAFLAVEPPGNCLAYRRNHATLKVTRKYMMISPP